MQCTITILKLHKCLLSWLLFQINHSEKLYKDANFAIFVYYGKTRVD